MQPKSCPFCGEFFYRIQRKIGADKFTVHCDNCHAEGPTSKTIESAEWAFQQRLIKPIKKEEK